MSDSPDSLYEALQEETILGPEHHRFKLIKQSSTHPLGQLWQAEDLSVTGNPLVTLLILSPNLLKQGNFAEGIKKHASLSKQIQNKHIAECYGFFTEKSRLLFLSYEKLDGLTLQSMLQKGSQLKPAQQMGLIKQIAYAIDIGYQKLHTPHASLEPASIFINRKGGVKLTLFSLRETLESVASLLSEPFHYKQYQSPEAFHPGKLTRKTDVYSFACILYELMTGKAPFSLDDSEADRVRRELSQPAGLDDEQWAELQKALSTNLDDRFPNCTELVKALFPPEKEEDSKEAEKAESSAEQEADNKNAGIADDSAADTGDSEEEGKRSLKDKLPSLKIKLPSLPKYVTYSLAGITLFASGYLLGWFVSDFINFKEKDFQALQIKKQQEALQQMFSSIQAQQELQEKLEQEAKAKDTDIEILKSDLAVARMLAKGAEPEDPGNQIFKDQIDSRNFGPEMVLLPSGEFRMGDQSGLGDDNEKPVHIVHIDEPFAISRFEVTFAEYDLFAKSTNRPLPDDEGWGRGNQPVINVSWRDAWAYTEWLADQTGQPYRLPSEAEWEYAARAGNLTTYWWGDNMQFNMAACADCGSTWDGKRAAPVGTFPANSWGLHDMTGNVDEWVADCYEDNYDLAPIDGSAYRKRVCKDRVMRGGSWFEISRLIRPASRYRHPVDSKRNSWGFRVAVDINK